MQVMGRLDEGELAPFLESLLALSHSTERGVESGESSSVDAACRYILKCTFSRAPPLIKC